METSSSLTLNPIGFFRGEHVDRYALPRQPGLGTETEGRIELLPHCNYEVALADLEGFERIWVVTWFHGNATWKPKVLPPRGGVKRGVFATRSPHRPNPIGLSCLKLLRIEKRTLFVAGADLIDGTPIFDLKPYVEYADCFPGTRQGWLEDLAPEHFYHLELAKGVLEQIQQIAQRDGLDLEPFIAQRLTTTPHPYPGRRIRHLADGRYQLAIKAWRVYYLIEEEEQRVLVVGIESGDVKELGVC